MSKYLKIDWPESQKITELTADELAQLNIVSGPDKSYFVPEDKMEEVNKLIEWKNDSAFVRAAKEVLGEDWDPENCYDSADEWLDDKDFFTHEDVVAIYNVMAAIADGDDSSKYWDLSEEYFNGEDEDEDEEDEN